MSFAAQNHDHGEATYQAPRDCPVCAHRLHVTQLDCAECGSALTGTFTSCRFCGLSSTDEALLRVFLTSRGNLREVERHLGVSYPTARLRFDELLARLGYVPSEGPDTAADLDSAGHLPSTEELQGQDSGDLDQGATSSDPRLIALQALARGEINLAQAKSVIDGSTEQVL